jgi:ribose 5-phosphate isomerase B
MNIYLAADHRGFELKKTLKQYLTEQNHSVIDCGNLNNDQNDDYPDIVFPLVEKISLDKNALGIVICGSGVGVSVAANRFLPIRCGLGFSEIQVLAAKKEDNINVLALAADFLEPEQAKKMVDIFLKTPYNQVPRYERRLKKINTYANRTRNLG